MKKLIFFVEDDHSTVDVYKTALDKTGNFKVEVFYLGKEVIEKIKDNKAPKPDLILLDFILPDINGLEILKEIRGRAETKNLPVIILTNYGDHGLSKVDKEFKNEKRILKTECTPSQLIEVIKDKLK